MSRSRSLTILLYCIGMPISTGSSLRICISYKYYCRCRIPNRNLNALVNEAYCSNTGTKSRGQIMIIYMCVCVCRCIKFQCFLPKVMPLIILLIGTHLYINNNSIGPGNSYRTSVWNVHAQQTHRRRILHDDDQKTIFTRKLLYIRI